MKLSKVLQRFTAVIGECGRVIYISRDIGMQRRVLLRINTVKNLIFQQKAFAKANESEPLANHLLALSCILESLSCEIQCYILLKEGQAENAWQMLVSAQEWVTPAVMADIGQKPWCMERIERLTNVERGVFPPQTYVSSGLIIGGSICSICNHDYASDLCTHIAGAAYMGEFCTRRVTGIIKLDHLAIVENPRSKSHRVTEVEGRNAITGTPMQASAAGIG